jgi:prephenate dehydrogenase
MKLALIGVGLIGGSFALALRAAREVDAVAGFDVDARALAIGMERGVLTRRANSLIDAVGDADLVVVATPVGALRDTLAAIAPGLPPAAVITDVGSTKQSVIDDACATLGAGVSRFVPSHPIAGGERPGVAHADPGLFAGRLAITTPTPQTDAGALQQVERLWRAVGARVERLSPADHDRIFAAVSHLPHVLAFALVDMIARSPEAAACFAHAGAGFRDFTRIAASSPEMWRDVCLANRAPLLAQLASYRGQLAALEEAIAAADDEALRRMFDSAAQARRAFGTPSAGT